MAHDLTLSHVQDLDSEDGETRWRAAERIGMLPRDYARPAIGSLILAMREEQQRVRVAAANSLYQLSPLPREYVEDLVEALQDDRAAVRGWCVGLLAGLAAVDDRARAALECVARGDLDEGVRDKARLGIKAGSRGPAAEC